MKKLFDGNGDSPELRYWSSLLAISAYGVKNSPYHQPFEVYEDQIYRHPIDYNVKSVVLEGIEYISINEALHLLYCASRSSNFAEVELRRMLRWSPLKCAQMAEAPDHPVEGMQGKIANVRGTSSFWLHAWWFTNAMSHPNTSREWRHWLLNGGVVVEKKAVEDACLDVIKSTHQDDIRIVRNRYPDMVPITEALSVAISHKFGIDFDRTEEYHEWIDLINLECTDSIFGAMHDGFELLIEQINCRKLQMWALCNSDLSPVPVNANDVYGAKLIVGSNSGGLLGFSDVKSFALFYPKELNTAFFSASYKARSVSNENALKSIVGRPKGAVYDDGPIIKEVMRLLDGPEKISRARAIRIALDRHGGGQGASERAITERIAAAVRKIRRRSS